MKKRKTKLLLSPQSIKKSFKLVRFLVLYVLFGVHSMFGAQSYSQVTHLDIEVKKTSLRSIFDIIENQSEFELFYNNDQVDDQELVDVHVTNGHINDVLNQALSGKYSYEIVDRHVLISKSTGAKSGQQKKNKDFTIRGTVYDGQEPPETLIGVSIRVKGTDDVTITDVDGFFSIAANKGDVLVFSYLGFGNYEHKVTRQQSDLIVTLKETRSTLDEVVVTGMNEQQRKHVASSISSLNVDSRLSGKPITSISQALQGGITGINASQASGLPGGDAASIKIRGVSTLGFSDPLVLVDGIPMDMNHIDPTTIEDVTVLKDAAAAAVYGSRAANGVIMITTKRGKAGRVVVSYDGYYGVQSAVNTPKAVGAVDYMLMYNEALRNTGKAEEYSEEYIANTLAGTDPMRYPDTNWVDLIVSKHNPITNHSVGISGGNNISRFAITVGYMYQKGMIPKTETDKLNIRANTTVNLASNLTMNLDALLIKRDFQTLNRTQVSNGNHILGDIYRVPPTILPRYPDDGSGKAFYGQYADIVNPLAFAERGGTIKTQTAQSSVNIQPKWNVFDSFNVKGQFFMRLNSDLTRTKRNTTNFFDYSSGALTRTWGQVRGAAQGRSFYYTLGLSADYNKSLGKHYIYALAGYSQEEFNEGDRLVRTFVSGYSKVNYAYDDRYLLEVVGRVDGSSRFGPGEKYGFFPSVAAGWNIHNESFMKNNGFLNSLKLRTSYGILGNENIGFYRYQTLISNVTGVEESMGNPNITWETVNMLDVGLDIGILADNKLELVVDYYDKLTKDIILEPQVSFVAGFPGQIPLNAGEVRNRGFEISVNYNEKINDDWRFTFSPGFSYNKNKVEKLYAGEDIITDGRTINREGYPVNSLYGFKTDGLLQQSDFDSNGNPLIPVATNAQPGDIKYLDLNNNGTIDDGDREIIGNPIPKINYFVNASVSYKNFDLEFLLQGVGNTTSELQSIFARPLDAAEGGGVPTTYYADRYWTPERTDARFPRLSTEPAMNRWTSDFWFQNAAYLRVKFIQLGYNFDSKLLNHVGLSQARVYVNAQNPITFTSTKLVDPESRGNQWTYGVQKAYTVGVSVKF